MNASMDVGVRVLIDVGHRQDHRSRALARRGVVEVDERFALRKRRREDGKILSDSLDV
jgi:hypothetical protein